MAAAVTFLTTAVLALRRLRPLTTVTVVALGIALPEVVTTLTITLWGDLVPLLVAVYSVARHADRTRAAAGLVLAAGSIAYVMLRIPVLGTPGNIPFTGVPMLGLFGLGLVLQQRADRHHRLLAEAEAAEAERDDQVQRAIQDERARIARELHDLVAHSVSVMVIQAGAAEDLLERDPDAAKEPLAVVQETGRQAVRELAAVLGLLRGPTGRAGLEPQPDERALPALVERMRAGGLELDADLPPLPPLPPSIGLALYRVTQEGLTNALKHGGGAPTTLRLVPESDRVKLSIINGRRPSSSVGTGNGLIGIRERVAIHGGTVESGPIADDRFRLRVVLPIGPSR